MNTTAACEHLSEALARHIDGRGELAAARDTHRSMRTLIERCGAAVRLGNDYAIRARLREIEESADAVMAHQATAGAFFAKAQTAARAAAAALTEAQTV